MLEQVLALPASVSHPIRNRFKVMARADIAVRHKPQDGAFHVKVGGRAILARRCPFNISVSSWVSRTFTRASSAATKNPFISTSAPTASNGTKRLMMARMASSFL